MAPAHSAEVEGEIMKLQRRHLLTLAGAGGLLVPQVQLGGQPGGGLGAGDGEGVGDVAQGAGVGGRGGRGGEGEQEEGGES